MRFRFLAAIAAAVLIAGCAADHASTADPLHYTADNFTSRTTDAWLKVKTAHVTLSLGSAPTGITGKGVVLNGPSAKTSAFRAKYKSPGPDFEIRAVAGIIYINYGEMTKHKFIRIDPDDPDNELSRLFAPIVESMDPSFSVRKFPGAVSRVKRNGSPMTLDGVETIPYAVTIDTDKIKTSGLLDGVPKGAIPKKLNYVFHMAADDVPRRVVFHAGLGGDLVMNFTKVGEPVRIIAPDKSEQIDQSILRHGPNRLVLSH